MAKARNITGAKIKQARTENDMFQADLSAALEVDFELKISRSDISEIECGTRSVRDYEIDAIASVLGHETGWFFAPKKAPEK